MFAMMIDMAIKEHPSYVQMGHCLTKQRLAVTGGIKLIVGELLIFTTSLF